MRNIRLVLEYDGTAYVGWQRQPEGRSVQGEIEQVLRTILGERVGVIGAGRTDSGVHARGQVANFRTGSLLTAREIMGGLNGLLPEDIVVHRSEDVPPDFHARYSAKGRTYSYLIRRAPAALLRHFCWQLGYPLDAAIMNAAADCIAGLHEFRSFCKSGDEVDDARCTVRAASWSEDGDFLAFRISADRFIHGMVRALVGTMVDVGRGHTSLDRFRQILDSGHRSESGQSAPARGLVLEEVEY